MLGSYNEKLVKPFTEYFLSKGVTINGICSMLANLYAESALYPTNLQNSYNKKWNITDEEYTRQIDEHKRNFEDGAGYGLCQWTYYSRKRNLLKLATDRDVSVGSAHIQFEYLYWELTNKYRSVWNVITNPASTISDCTRRFMLDFERPANQSEANQQKRVEYATDFYNKYFAKAPEVKYSRDVYMNKMRSFLGAADGNAKHKEIVDIYNSFLPHPRGYKLSINDPWCAATVSAAAIAVGYTAIYPIECSCTQLIKQAQTMGIWQENDAYIPKPADLILYDWEDDGKGDNKDTPNHIGAVEVCSNGSITVIEGNYDGVCKRRVIKVNGRYIRGFICPKYNEQPQPTPQPELIVYVVQKGDTLTKIANMYNTTVDVIMSVNPQIKDKNKIYTGQKILIPC